MRDIFRAFSKLYYRLKFWTSLQIGKLLVKLGLKDEEKQEWEEEIFNDYEEYPLGTAEDWKGIYNELRNNSEKSNENKHTVRFKQFDPEYYFGDDAQCLKDNNKYEYCGNGEITMKGVDKELYDEDSINAIGDADYYIRILRGEK